MKKRVIINSVVYLICMVAACLLNLAVSGLVVKIVLSVADIGYFATSVLRVVVGFLTGGVVIGLIVGRESYKSLEIHPVQTGLSMLFASVVHLLLCLLLMFYPFIAGGVRDLAGILCMGDGFTSEELISDIYLWAYFVAFAIYFLFQLGSAFLGAWIGKKVRLKGREGLEGFYENQETAE